MAKTKKQRRHALSCLGVLLCICMLLLAGITLGVNLLYRSDNAPKIGKYRFCYYDTDDMAPDIPKGTVVIAQESGVIPDQQLALYRSSSGKARIGKVGTKAENAAFSSTTYYLTVSNSIDPEPVAVPARSVLGLCTHKSPELGVAVGFLTGMVGCIIGLLAPCVVLLLVLIAAALNAKEQKRQADEPEEEGDTDLAFVKSIRKKQQQIAERDAERIAKSGTEAEKPAPAKQPRRYTDEELRQLEEQEAARRAERIAAVRTHMEQRRQTETPDGVPLYTTEVITRTHSLQVPKTGELTVTRTSADTTGQITKPAETEKPEKPAQTEQPAPAPEAPAEPAPAPEEPPADPASYDELMSMLDDEIKKLQS